jgi:hypothetical protein
VKRQTGGVVHEGVAVVRHPLLIARSETEIRIAQRAFQHTHW